jgi:hypothetical protein
MSTNNAWSWWRLRRLVDRPRVRPAGRPSAPNYLKLAVEILLTSYKYPPYLPWCRVWRKLGLASYSATKVILCRVERERRGFEGLRTSQIVESAQSSSSTKALPESIRVRWSFSSSSSVECGSSTRILWIPIERRLSSPSSVSGSRLVGIPMTLPQSGWFANHSKPFIHFTYVICAFTYRIVELLFVLSYIQSHVWGSIEYSGTRCGGYYLIPRRLTALIRRKILHNAVDEVSEALPMHVAPPAIRIVMVPAGLTVLLGLHNPPRGWTGTVDPSLPGFTIAPCVNSLLCYRLIGRPKSFLEDSPKI